MKTLQKKKLGNKIKKKKYSFVLCFCTYCIPEPHFSKQSPLTGIILKAVAAVCRTSRKQSIKSPAAGGGSCAGTD